MKICPNCGNTVEDSAIFCDKCGTRLLTQNNAQGNYAQYPNNQSNYTQQQQYNYGMDQPQYQPATPQIQPKKKNTGLIIGIIAAVLVVLAIIGIVAEKVFQAQGYGEPSGNNRTPSYTYGDSNSSDDDSSSTTDTSGNDDTSSYTYSDSNSFDEGNNSTTDNNVLNDVKTYNKGSVVDGWYVNEWANIRFDTSGSWTDGSAEEYGVYEGDPNIEFGIILNDVINGKQLTISYEKLIGADVFITEEEYLDNFTSALKELYAEANLPYTIADYYDTTIAGEIFKTAKFTFDGSAMVQAFHVRYYDGYMIFMGVTAPDNFDASSIVNNIRTVD